MHPHPADAPSFYVNLPVADPEASLKFFVSLGLSQITAYSDTKTKAFRLPGANSNICVMFHAHSRFQDFIRPSTPIIDAKSSTESLFSIAVATVEDVDQWLEKAVEAGGQKDPFELPKYGAECGMYTRSFADLDGHIWEMCTMLPGSKCPGAAEKEEKE